MTEQQEFMYHLAEVSDINPDNFPALKQCIELSIATMTIQLTGFDLVLIEFDCDDLAFSGKMNYTVFQTALDTHRYKHLEDWGK